MSRFQELDDLFKRQIQEQEDKENEILQKAMESREKHEDAIRAAFSVFGDFYKTVLLPRVPFQIISRKKDGPTTKDLERPDSHNPYWAYVINLVPPEERRPFGFKYDERLNSDWTQPLIDERNRWHDWYPMSAMQFTVLLSPKWLYEQKKHADDLNLSVQMAAWGSVDIDNKSLLPQGLSIYHGDGGWNRDFTSIIADYQALENFEEGIGQGLTLLAPQVLMHKEAVEGTYRWQSGQ